MDNDPRSDYQSLASYYAHPLNLEDDFRLVEVLSGTREDEMILRLFNTRLRDAPPYEALSYTWGDAKSQKSVRLSSVGMDGDRFDTMLITENCYSALKHLRRVDSPRTMWIDSICINQSADIERNHQLDLISQIYRQASRVVVYIGESADNSDEAMDWISENHEPSNFGNETGLSYAQPNLAAIQALLQRSWFTRVWVLQEIAFSTDAIVCCGDREVSWESFKTFKQWNVGSKSIRTLPYVIDSISSTSSTTAYLSPSRELQEKLRATRQCQATDPRDKLFAILPLLDTYQGRHFEQSLGKQQTGKRQDNREDNNEEASTRAVPQEDGLFSGDIVDYRLTPAQVFLKLSIHLLRTLGLNILCDVIGPPSHPGLPSWAPDWSVSLQHTYGRNPEPSKRGLRLFDRYHAGSASESPDSPDQGPSSHTTRPPWKVSTVALGPSIDTYQLHAPAVRVGIVKAIGSMCDVDKNIFPLREWELLADQHHVGRYRRGNNTSGLRAFELLLVMGFAVYPHVVLTGLNLIRKYDGGDQEEQDSDPAETNHSSTETKSSLRDVMKGLFGSFKLQAKVLFEACDGRRFFVTDTGHIGLAPDFARVGDSVYVLKGASMPFIFRESPHSYANELKTVTLVGECYVQGIMKGQIWADASKVEELVII